MSTKTLRWLAFAAIVLLAVTCRDAPDAAFVVEVHRAWAPIGADRFFNLVRLGFYDDTRVYRIRDGVFVMGINTFDLEDGVLRTVETLPGQLDRLVLGQAADPSQERRQVFTIHVSHRDVVLPVDLAEADAQARMSPE